MKKRILSLMLICIMLLSIVLTAVSCGEHSKVNKAMENTRALKHLDADLLLDLSVEVNDREQYGVDSKGNPKYRENWDARDYAIAQKVLEAILEDGTAIGQEKGGWYGDKDSHDSTYFDKDFAYLPNGTKQQIDEYKKYNTYYPDLVRALFVDLEKELFEEKDDGSKKIKLEEAGGISYLSASFSMSNDGEKATFEQILSPVLNEITSSVAEYMECNLCRDGKNSCDACFDKAVDCAGCAEMRKICKTCKISNIEFSGDGKIEYKLENGYATEAQIEFQLEMDVGEDKLYVEGKLKAIINAPGTEIGIKFPHNYESYPLVTVSKRPTLSDLLK